MGHKSKLPAAHDVAGEVATLFIDIAVAMLLGVKN